MAEADRHDRAPGGSAVELHTPRLRLYLPGASEAHRVLRYFDGNRTHLEPWEPRRPDDFYTERFWYERLAANRDEHSRGVSMRLFFELKHDPRRPIIGAANFTNIVRGAFMACYLGYSLGRVAQGQGLMTEALRAAVPAAFEDLGLHRIMANYRPENGRSAKVLSRLGFEIEGYARDYLYIDGAWRDHVLTARVRRA
jgi:ribosomal-protein-alanine N-acetyltransferase